MMKDTVDRMIKLGLGLVATGKDQIEKVVEELVERGEVSRQESKALVESWIKKGESTRLQIEYLVKERIDHLLNESSLATKDDIAQLERRIEKIEQSGNAHQ